MAADAQPGLTDQQRLALGKRGVSVALSAGAGCGKTFVLTRRFLEQLEPEGGKGGRPARLGELVAITITDRAAREMRDRIRQECHRRLLEAPERQVDYWLNLLRELDSARISTIHAFCASLLRSHAVEAGLDPRFRVLEQSQADTLLDELIDDQLRSRLAAGDEAVLDLVVEFGLERLREMVRMLLSRRQVGGALAHGDAARLAGSGGPIARGPDAAAHRPVAPARPSAAAGAVRGSGREACRAGHQQRSAGRPGRDSGACRGPGHGQHQGVAG
jgi:hypothetical protein